MGKCVSLRDSEKSLEKTRMDLYRSPFFSCESPLICYYIFKWNQFVVNSARLQGYKASAVKQKMETSLHLDPETISIHSVNSKQQLILSNRGVEVEGWFKSRKWNLSLWMYILICNFLCIYDISSNIISLVHWPSGKFLMNLLNAEDSTQFLGRYFAMVKKTDHFVYKCFPDFNCSCHMAPFPDIFSLYFKKWCKWHYLNPKHSKHIFFIHTTPLVFNILHSFILHNYLLQN